MSSAGNGRLGRDGQHDDDHCKQQESDGFQVNSYSYPLHPNITLFKKRRVVQDCIQPRLHEIADIFGILAGLEPEMPILAGKGAKYPFHSDQADFAHTLLKKPAPKPLKAHPY